MTTKSGPQPVLVTYLKFDFSVNRIQSGFILFGIFPFVVTYQTVGADSTYWLGTSNEVFLDAQIWKTLCDFLYSLIIIYLLWLERIQQRQKLYLLISKWASALFQYL